MKQDKKLLSKQKHEIAYVRKLARLELAKNKGRKLGDSPAVLTLYQMRRLCKAVLKFAK